MIKVTFAAQKEVFVSLTVEGHAQYAKKGEDLVCAGVSAVSIGGLNALENPDVFDIEVTDALISVKAKTTITQHDEIVLRTILEQLETIEESYPENVKVTKSN